MTQANLSRYARQMSIPAIGAEGQRRLAAGRVAVVGCGALGCASASLLARAGVGYLRLVDRDFVELTNLQRQCLYEEEDVRSGLPKAAIAEARLRRANSEITVESMVVDFSVSNAEQLLEGVDVIVDATDNFEARFLLNDVAVKHGTPWVYGACIGTQGVTMNILPGEGPCLRCLLPEAPGPGTVDTCATGGIFGPAVQSVAALQVAETVKLLVGARAELRPGLVQLDVWSGELELFPVPRAPGCPTCGAGDYQYLRAEATAEVASLCGQDALQIVMPRPQPLALADLAERLETAGLTVQRTPFMLRFRAEEHELNVFPDGRAIIKGTVDPTVGRTLYAKYVGT